MSAGFSSSTRLLVIGVGLIGGSLAVALKQAGAVARVTGVGRRAAPLQKAVELGVLDDWSLDLRSVASSSDLVFLGVPVGAMPAILRELSTIVDSRAVITDAGSTKVGPVEAARIALGSHFERFVPGHPIAGSERSGVGAAQAGLYRNHKVILTPEKDTDPAAVGVVEAMWEAAGATVEHMSAWEHDRVLALTSHLPHVLAYALVDYIAGDEDANRCFELAAGGFLDFTRIASSDPEMWRDICMDNMPCLTRSLGGFIAALEQMKSLIEQGHATDIEQVFRRARETRERVIDNRRR